MTAHADDVKLLERARDRIQHAYDSEGRPLNACWLPPEQLARLLALAERGTDDTAEVANQEGAEIVGELKAALRTAEARIAELVGALTEWRADIQRNFGDYPAAPQCATGRLVDHMQGLCDCAAVREQLTEKIDGLLAPSTASAQAYDEARRREGLRVLRCSETKSGMHEWRANEYEDAREANWCCRCAQTATQMIDAAIRAEAGL